MCYDNVFLWDSYFLFKGEKMRSGEDSFLYTLTEKFETHCLIMDMQNRILGKTEKVPPNL